MSCRCKYLKKASQYKNVACFLDSNGTERWRAIINKNSFFFDSERDAAMAIDKHLIENGKEPINILKRK